MKNERAIEILKNFVGCNLGFLSGEEYEALELAIKTLEQPQGEWIKNPKTFCWECSECHEVPTKYTDWNISEEQLKDYRFCRWCGAKMKGGAK